MNEKRIERKFTTGKAGTNGGEMCKRTKNWPVGKKCHFNNQIKTGCNGANL